MIGPHGKKERREIKSVYDLIVFLEERTQIFQVMFDDVMTAQIFTVADKIHKISDFSRMKRLLALNCAKVKNLSPSSNLKVYEGYLFHLS